ncbi:Tail fiber protein [compost metagenome]
MSQVITDAFASYWQQCLVDQTPVVLDEFVLAHIPGLDPDAPIDPASGLPPADQIVHRHAVDQRGRINNDAVAYSIVMDTTVGDFTFNAMYLINTGLNLVGMIVHKGEETKLKTDPASGQTGNSLVKSMLMEYDRAAEASQTVIDASTWQIDYAARLRGMDEDMRRQAMGTFGHAAFYGDGFKLVNNAGLYKVQPGQGYVGGLLVELSAEQEVTPSAKPVSLWLDAYRAGSLLSPWVNHITLTLSTADLVDYVDANGYPHFVTKLATINADDSVTDTRARRTLTLTGDVTGQVSFNGPDSIELEVTIEDNSHGHTIDNVEGLQEALDGKAEQDHTHSPAEIGALPSGNYVPLRDALAATNLSMSGADTVDFDAVGPGYCHLVDVTASTGTKPTGFGSQYGFLTVQYIYGGNSDGNRALLMKLEPYDGNGRTCWRNYSINNDAWATWRYAYTDQYKPTAAEVGAVPASEGTAEYARQLIPKNSSWGDQTDRFRTGSAQAPVGSGRTEYVDWIQWGHNGGQKIRHTLWCPADSSKSTELWFAYLNNTTDTDGPATHWRIYHQGFKPTAAEVGAAPTAHAHFETLAALTAAFGTTYTNTSGKTMFISVTTFHGGDDDAVECRVNGNRVSYASIAMSGEDSDGTNFCQGFFVPNGGTWGITQVNGTETSIQELWSWK